jgi:hypothetical protein
MRMAATATANRLLLVEHWRSVPTAVCELVLSSCLAACTMLFAGRSGPPTRHQDQRPALHTKVTTAGVCDETASAGLHVGVIDANVEACLVSRDLFGSEEPENDPRLIRERVARRFCCRRSYAYILLRAALMSRARKHRSCRRFFLQGVSEHRTEAPIGGSFGVRAETTAKPAVITASVGSRSGRRVRN